MKVGEFVVGSKHKPAERAAIYEPKSKDLPTDENKILDATLRYNIGVVKKDLKDVQDKNDMDEQLMNSTERCTQSRYAATHTKTLRHLKKKKKSFYIMKAGHDFQEAIFDYMAAFMFHQG